MESAQPGVDLLLQNPQRPRTTGFGMAGRAQPAQDPARAGFIVRAAWSWFPEADFLYAPTIRAVYVTHYRGMNLVSPSSLLQHFSLDFTLADDRLVVANFDLVLAA